MLNYWGVLRTILPSKDCVRGNNQNPNEHTEGCQILLTKVLFSCVDKSPKLLLYKNRKYIKDRVKPLKDLI